MAEARANRHPSDAGPARSPQDTASAARKPHILIIGAGTGGLALAQGLLKHGVATVAVYERDRTRMDGLQGYRVGISAGGSSVLNYCLPPDLYATFVATCGRSPRYFNMITEQLTTCASIRLPEAFISDPVYSEKSVSRMTMRQVLLTGLEEVVHFDHVFDHYKVDDVTGRVTATFTNGATATGDLLVGADGANSAVRRQLLPAAQLEDTGIRAIGGKVPITPETRCLLPQHVFEGLSMLFAEGGYFMILHVMEFSWGKGGAVKEGVELQDKAAIEAWPGLLYDNTRDYIMWGLSSSRTILGQQAGQPFEQLTREELLPLVRKVTSSWSPQLQQLIAATDPSTVFRINIRTSVPLEAWEPSVVTCIGDAMHTMTPGRGIGANTALRDALVLVKGLQQLLAPSKQEQQEVQDRQAVTRSGSSTVPEGVAATVTTTTTGSSGSNAVAEGVAPTTTTTTTTGTAVPAAAPDDQDSAGGKEDAVGPWTRDDLIRVVAKYEAAMRVYGYKAVLDSRQQMDERNLLYHPLWGRPVLLAMRWMWRLVAALPGWLQQRLFFNTTLKGRGHKGQEDWLAA